MEPHGAAQAHVQKGMKTAWNLLFDSRNLRSSVVRRSIVAGHNQPLSHCLKAGLIWFLRLVVLACPVASAAFTRSREPKQMTLDSWTLWPSPSDWFQSLNSQATSKLHTHTHTQCYDNAPAHTSGRWNCVSVQLDVKRFLSSWNWTWKALSRLWNKIIAGVCEVFPVVWDPHQSEMDHLKASWL